ncbi:DUF1753-domain-containing protein [Fomitiporia mediterranea MF3/22]|uniref:DUF1753-domain-containing protein n=1 Tax=Fomitiporia mediterranea (strain MF3/22) TaxID=694068 RepID=UPI0004409597|nr:DUF1753-domain-containing protein [Fomitiporia mediterranea MF3/22]EJD07610.1 DUF1753-domain-containing protein [Fomitiporia mediterranea MF3/22]
MKLTLKQQWRPRPLNSFLGFVDIKLGVTIALLFATENNASSHQVLNKVAGVYGLIAVFTGGSFAQLSMYIYSVVALIAFGWALKAVTEEDPRRTLYFAHLFFADHVLSTVWTVFFAVVWWIYTPHDGRRQANSAAQEQLMQGGSGHNMTEEERTLAAMRIWNKEKGMAAAVIIIGWCAKVYFAILIYSYAIHLRKGSYRSLPRTTDSIYSQYTSLNGGARGAAFPESVLDDEDEESADGFYRMPVTSLAQVSSRNSAAPKPGSSVTSFSDFTSAPGRGRRFRSTGAAAISGDLGTVVAGKAKPEDKETDYEEEVLFDSDELTHSTHSKFGTEESTSVSSRDDEASGRRTPGDGGLSRERTGYNNNSFGQP